MPEHLPTVRVVMTMSSESKPSSQSVEFSRSVSPADSPGGIAADFFIEFTNAWYSKHPATTDPINLMMLTILDPGYNNATAVYEKTGCESRGEFVQPAYDESTINEDMEYLMEEIFMYFEGLDTEKLVEEMQASIGKNFYQLIENHCWYIEHRD